MNAIAEINTANAADTPPNFEAIKVKQQAAWGSGDYAVVGSTLNIVGEMLAEAADINPDETVLDVAAGNGNATLAAARRSACVTSTDYVESLLEKARARTQAEQMDVNFQQADVERLPFADNSFDAVISTFGCMFAPDQHRTAQEMIRVVKSGGRVAMANWTPDSFIGELFKVIGRHVPPPKGVQSPGLWGDRAHLEHLFGAEASRVSITRRVYNFRYRSVAEWLEVFRTFYGPTHKAFLALDSDGQHAMAQDMSNLAERFNVRTDGRMVVPGDYAEVVITKRLG
ncbi:MAG: class I SAM-dependent methyltransferase [Paracoccaceae bacterium]